MRKVKVKPNKNGDSRVADHVPTIEEFMEANFSHREDVSNLMREFADEIKTRGKMHDWTKTNEPYSSMFYRDLCETIEGKISFFEGEWSKKHYEELERHHLNRSCPEDVNLIDVLEMICDCIVAGKARSGNIYEITIDDDILKNAVKNTVEILKNNVVVEE